VSNGVPPESESGLPTLLNPSAAFVPGQTPQAFFGSPLLETRPPKPRLINSASGGLNLQYTTDIFAIDANGNPTVAYNPFIGNAKQAARVRAFCVIKINGLDITDRIMPFLISVRIIHRPLLTAEIEIDDRKGWLPLPPVKADVEIQLGWVNERSGLLFNGKVWEVEYSDARQGGRHMTVHVFGIDITNKIKEPGHDNLGEGAPPGQNEGIPHSLQEWIQKEAGLAGVTVDYFSPKTLQFQRDHWDRNGESFMQLVTRECERHGLIPFWHDGHMLTIAGFGESPITIIAQARINLISLRVRPYVSRGVWNADEQHYFDTLAGQWKRVKVGMEFDASVDAVSGAIANALHPAPAASRMEAQDDAAGGANLAMTNTGHGRICINGEPTARFLCHVQVVDVRPGVDGDYIAWDAVEHIYSRQGYITWLDVRTNPYAGASSNVLHGYLSNEIAQLPLSAIAYGGTPGQVVVPAPPLSLPGLLDPGVNPATAVPSPGISSLPIDQPGGGIGSLPPETLNPFGP
jgi:Bacteriophage probable baseplate hub protein